MKRALFAIPFIAGLAGCGDIDLNLNLGHMGPGVKGSGNVKHEHRSVGEFTGVQAGGAIKLEVRAGLTPSVSVEADDNLLPFIRTRVEGDTLVIDTTKSISTHNKISVKVTTRQLLKTDLSGASEADLSDINSDHFSLVASGASRIKAAGNFGNLTAELSGASHLVATGSSKEQSIELSGASHADLEGLPGESAKLEASGASHAALKISGAVMGEASGASSVTVTGASSVSVQTSGASHVRKN